MLYIDLVDTSFLQTISTIPLEIKGQPRLTSASWNPHHASKQLATCNDQSIRGWDLRTNK